MIFDQIQPVFDINWTFFDITGPEIEFGIKIGHGFQIVTTILKDFSNNFGSKKSTKSRFKSNLE